MISTTIITPTIGTDELEDACISVANQTVQCLHFIVVDGEEYKDKALDIAMSVQVENPNTYIFKPIVLPFNTGSNGVLGHRIYPAIANISPTPFFSFLDEDNWIAHNWVQTMQNALYRNENAQYVTCRRTVTDQDKNIIGLDNKESVGDSELGYRLYDTSTYMFKASMAIMTPYMAIKYYTNDSGIRFGDRDLTNAIFKVPHVHLEHYHGTFYRSPERLTQFFKEICDE